MKYNVLRSFLISFLVMFVVGCASHTPAPVVNRSPQAATPSATAKSEDWRPNNYTVKKGDTLYSIGLEHGYDYREIAAANNIYAPYTIKIGQTLNFSSLNKEVTGAAKPTAYESEDGVIISPIDVDAPSIEETVKPSTSTTQSTTPPTLTAPKAIREPYSLEAFNRVPAAETPPTVVAKTEMTAPKVTETKTAEANKTGESASSKSENTPAKTASSVVEGVTWFWPTQGKVSATFNAASNKGIDIAGTTGQAIIASADGKVIYTGSDLRGYGKLVIVKHNNALLSVYAHNSKINIKEGQIVKAGQKIAEMGNTDANSVKLHFEIRQKGKSVDPALFLPKN
jgi:lipoprotein NlpD